MIGYLGTLWYTTAARASFEGKRNRLELDALNLQIKTLNLKAQAAPEVAWNGYRKFTVSRKVEECVDTYSYYLTPHDGKALPQF